MSVRLVLILFSLFALANEANCPSRAAHKMSWRRTRPMRRSTFRRRVQAKRAFRPVVRPRPALRRSRIFAPVLPGASAAFPARIYRRSVKSAAPRPAFWTPERKRIAFASAGVIGAGALLAGGVYAARRHSVTGRPEHRSGSARVSPPSSRPVPSVRADAQSFVVIAPANDQVLRNILAYGQANPNGIDDAHESDFKAYTGLSLRALFNDSGTYSKPNWAAINSSEGTPRWTALEDAVIKTSAAYRRFYSYKKLGFPKKMAEVLYLLAGKKAREIVIGGMTTELLLSSKLPALDAMIEEIDSKCDNAQLSRAQEKAVEKVFTDIKAAMAPGKLPSHRYGNLENMKDCVLREVAGALRAK